MARLTTTAEALRRAIPSQDLARDIHDICFNSTYSQAAACLAVRNETIHLQSAFGAWERNPTLKLSPPMVFQCVYVAAATIRLYVTILHRLSSLCYPRLPHTTHPHLRSRLKQLRSRLSPGCVLIRRLICSTGNHVPPFQ